MNAVTFLRKAGRALAHPRIAARRLRNRFLTAGGGGGDKTKGNQPGPRKNVNTREYWNSIWGKEGLDRRKGLVNDEVVKKVQPDTSLLDLGCGNGYLLRRLTEEKSCRCVGLDISDAVLKELEPFGVETMCAALPNVPCESDSFDTVSCVEALEHLDDPEVTLKEMHRVAKVGGLIIFSVPDGSIWGKGGEHMHVFEPSDCVNLLRPYVESVSLELRTDGAGWSFLICWGYKTDTPVKYARSK